MGPKFKGSKCADFEKAKGRIAEGIDDCNNTCWCTRKELFKYPR